MSEGFMAEYSDTELKEPPKKEEPKEEKIEVPPEDPPEVTPEEEPEEPSKQEKLENKAREGGWVPLEEWNGNPEEWVSAEVFNARGPLFEKIKYSNDKVDRLEKQIATLVEINKKTAENERKKALAELQGKKVQLMQEGDYEGVIKVEGEIEKTKEVPKEEPKSELTPEQEQAKEKLTKWATDNKWYAENTKMKYYADAAGQDYMDKHPKASIDEILDYTVKEVREQFPEQFGDQVPPKSPVGSGGNSPPKKSEKEISLRDLDDIHRDLIKGFIEADNSGRTDKQIIAETIKEWREIGEIS